MTDKLLKLRAGDAEDVQVVSAILQDAIVPVCDMAFQAQDKSFVMVAQRLRRENADGAAHERICCAVTVRGVREAQTQNIDCRHKEQMLDLLAVIHEPASSVLTLIFADNARVRLMLDQWSLVAEDFGAPWPALCSPCHDDAAKS